MIAAMVPPLLRRPTIPGLQDDNQGRSVSFTHSLRLATANVPAQAGLESPISLSMPRSYPLEHSVSAPGQMTSTNMSLTSTKSTSSTNSSSSIASSNMSAPSSTYPSLPPTPSTLTSLRPPAAGSSLFQIATLLITRLSSVPDLGIYLMHARVPSPTDTPSMLFSASYLDMAVTPRAKPEADLQLHTQAADTSSNDIDPVTQLWRFLRQGTSLCVLFNALNRLRPSQERDLIVPNVQTILPSQQELKICKRGVYEFVQACKSRLAFEDENLFTIMNVFSDDTTDLLKVTRTVNMVLDVYDSLNLSNKTESADVGPLRHGPDAESLSGHTAPSDHRSKVVQELLQTERKYVQDLELLHLYMKQLQAQEIVSANTIHFMFPNLNTLVDFQRKFLVGIETNARLAPANQRFGAFFLRMEHGFNVYETYASQQKQAADLAVQEASKLAKLSHLIEPTYELPSTLIKPIQRICRYPLLLKELLKYTPEEDELYAELLDGFHAMKRVTDRINEAQRQADNKQALLSLCARIDDWKGHKIEHFGNLLLDGVFVCVEDDKEYHYYLFEKILLFCKEDMGSTAAYGRSISNGTNSGQSLASSMNPPSTNGVSSGTATQSKKKKNVLIGKKASLSTLSSSDAGGGSLTFDGRIYIDNITSATPTTMKSSFGDSSFSNGYVLTLFWRPSSSSQSRQYSIRFRNEEILRQWELAIRRLIAMRSMPAQSGPFMPYHGHNGLSQSSITSNSSSTFPSLSPLSLPKNRRRTSTSSSSSTAIAPHHTTPSPSQPASQSSQPNSIKVKLSFQNDSYLILLSSTATFAEMTKKVEKKLRLCNATVFDDIVISNLSSNVSNVLGYKMKYRDEDGDFVLLQDEEDWEVAADSYAEEGVVEIWVV